MLQVIALALTELIPMYWRDARTGEEHQLTEPELACAQFTRAVMEVLLVPKKRFEVALGTMQVESLDQARASLTLRQNAPIGFLGGMPTGTDTQRLRMVGRSCAGRCETNMNTAPAGGSSSPLRSALAAFSFMSSAGCTSATRRRPRCERM